MPQRSKPSFADSRAARIVALLVFALCVVALGYLHREDLFTPAPEERAAAANPAFVECRSERTGHVDKMLKEGVIDTAQHEQFVRRAVDYCAAQFPPGVAER